MIAMITVQRFDLEDGRAREQAIMLHIGRMTVKAAAIDEVMTTVLSRILAPSDETMALAAFGVEMFGTKYRFLERVLPKSWPDRKPLLAAIKMVEEYRNQLAHSTVHTTYALLEGTEDTRLHSFKGGWRNINPSEFARWEARAQITYAALWQLGNEDDPKPEHHEVRNLLRWHYGEALTPEISVAIDDLFPIMSDQ